MSQILRKPITHVDRQDVIDQGAWNKIKIQGKVISFLFLRTGTFFPCPQTSSLQDLRPLISKTCLTACQVLGPSTRETESYIAEEAIPLLNSFSYRYVYPIASLTLQSPDECCTVTLKCSTLHKDFGYQINAIHDLQQYFKQEQKVIRVLRRSVCLQCIKQRRKERSSYEVGKEEIDKMNR